MTTNPVYCTEFFYAREGCAEELKKYLKNLAEKAKSETGFLQYDVTISVENKNLFILIVKFTNQETMLAHEQQPYIIEFAEQHMDRLCEKVEWFDSESL